jgi:hypothetical protein
MPEIENFIKKVYLDESDYPPLNPELPNTLVVHSEELETEGLVKHFRIHNIPTDGFSVSISPSDIRVKRAIEYRLIKKARESDVMVIHYGMGSLDSRYIINEVSKYKRVIVLSGAAPDPSGYKEFSERKVKLISTSSSEYLQELIDELANI